MGNPARQWQLRWHDVTINLNSAPYTVLSQSGNGTALDLELRIEDTSVAAVERHMSQLRRILRAGSAYGETQAGYPLYVYTKRCDDLDTVAELGATWRRARVTAGAAYITNAQAPHLVWVVRINLELAEGVWRRAAPAPVLGGSILVATRTDGGLTASGAAVTARRLRWSSTTGITARYHWLYTAANCTFFKVNATCRAWWDEAAKRFKIQDNSTTLVQSSAYAFTAGAEVEVVFRWAPGAGLAVFVNGTADGSASACTFADGDPYTVFEPTGSQSLLSAQIWPAVLTDAQCTGLAAWGRPEAELPFYIAPANSWNHNQTFKLYGAPGEVSAPLRVILNSTSQDYDMVRLGLRTLRVPSFLAWEAEDGALGTATARVVDVNAANGAVARHTPTNTSWATRVTLTLAQNAADLAHLFGTHRVFLAGCDQAANVNVNHLRWRLVLAGIAEAWSDEIALAAVGSYSLCDMGELSLPPGSWPDESETVTSDVYSGAYATLEIQVSNLVGSGGGALDMDVVYLAPAETELSVSATDLSTTQYLVLDWISQQPNAIAVYDWRQMEFAGWADPPGDLLALEPGPGAGSVLWLHCFRNTVEEAYAKDAVSVQLQVLPGWMVG